MYICEHCKEKIISDGEIVNGNLYHYHCLKKIKELKEKSDRESRGLFFKCPNCNGNGYTVESYLPYCEQGYWTNEQEDLARKYRNVDCKVCDRQGYTPKQLKPITKVIGYE